MKNSSLDRYKPIKTALEEVGFKVDEVGKQGKKTVITVSHCEQSSHEYNNTNPPTPEKQGENGS